MKGVPLGNTVRPRQQYSENKLQLSHIGTDNHSDIWLSSWDSWYISVYADHYQFNSDSLNCIHNTASVRASNWWFWVENGQSRHAQWWCTRDGTSKSLPSAASHQQSICKCNMVLACSSYFLTTWSLPDEGAIRMDKFFHFTGISTLFSSVVLTIVLLFDCTVTP